MTVLEPVIRRVVTMGALPRAIVTFLALVAIAVAGANAQVASEFSHGPSIPFATIVWDETGDASAGAFNAGAGYSLNVNLLPDATGAVRWLNVGFPVFVQTDGSDFATAVGVTVGTFNNLVALGAAVDLVSVGARDSGLLLGELDRRNVKILLAFGFNIGGGSVAASSAARSRASLQAVTNETPPPPGYVRLGR